MIWILITVVVFLIDHLRLRYQYRVFREETVNEVETLKLKIFLLAENFNEREVKKQSKNELIIK